MKIRIRKRTLYVIILVILLAFFILLFMYVKKVKQIEQSEKYSNSMSEYYINKEKALEQRENDFNNNMEIIKNTYFENKISEILEEDDLIYLAKNKWKYELLINNKPLKNSNEKVVLSNESLEITLIETYNDSLMPPKILYYGSINFGNTQNKLANHIIIRSEYKYEVSTLAIENGTQIKYKFTSLNNGKIAVLQLTELLRERLKLEDKIIELFKE